MPAIQLFALWPTDVSSALPAETRKRISFVVCSTAATDEAAARTNANRYGRQEYGLDWGDRRLVGCVTAACFGPMPPEGYTSFAEQLA